MIGTMLGHIAGSRYELDNIKTKGFAFGGYFTDDSILTAAVEDAFVKKDVGEVTSSDVVDSLVRFGKHYLQRPESRFGNRMAQWFLSFDHRPYGSMGDGAPARIGPVGWVGKDEDEVKGLSFLVTHVTHDTPEALRGAECVTMCIFWARKGLGKAEIIERVERDYYALPGDYEKLRSDYGGSLLTQNVVPKAIFSFLRGTDTADAIKTAVSIGGDSDIIAAITGSIAEAFYGPSFLQEEALDKFKDPLMAKTEKGFYDYLKKRKAIEGCVDKEDGDGWFVGAE